MRNDVADVREEFSWLLENYKFVSPRGAKTIEIVGVRFTADEDSIFGTVDWDYVERELVWYESQSLNVGDIPGGAPKIWQDCASKTGWINSNYGWMIYSESNYSQYERVVEELKRDPHSRRAIMIYTRPSMHDDWNEDGMTDFCCTNTVQYLIRDGKVSAVVNMRSNDAVFGYKNDRAWQEKVLTDLARDLHAEKGDIVWCVGSLHVYERHFYLVDHWAKTGESITKGEYRILYPESEWAK